MATLIELNESTHTHLANQITGFIGIGALSVRAGENLELAEAFSVWMLPASDVFSSEPIAAITATGQWHHQIHQGGKPAAFARSRILGPRDTDWQLSGVFQSPLAEAIDAAITTADDANCSGEARLLLIPGWQITALWLHGEGVKEDMFIIADAPGGDDVPRNRPLATDELWAILRRLPVIDGRKP